MIEKKEKENIIIIMVIDMKEIGKMIKEKEKVYIIIKMVIGQWEIIIITKRLECMLPFILMGKFHLNILIKISAI